MSVIVGLAKNGPLLDRMRAASGLDVIGIWPGLTDRALLAELEDCGEIKFVFIGDEIDLARAFDVTNLVHRNYPDVPIVLSTEMPDVYSTSAKRLGATEVVGPALATIDLQRVIEKYTTDQSAPSATSADLTDEVSSIESSEHRIIVVLSPKGGVGKTTVSVNLAAALALRHPLQTVLIDYDDQFGDVSSALNLVAPHTVDEAFLPGGGVQDLLVLKGLFDTHEGRLLVLAGSDSPAAMEKVSSADAGRLLGALSTDYPLLVVDTASGLTDLTLAALEVATDVVFVTNMDVAAVKAMRRSVDILGRIGLLPARQYLVVNQIDPETGLSTSDIAQTLQIQVAGEIERSSEVPYSMNVGRPLSDRRAPHQLKSAIDDLINSLGGRAAKSDSSALGRLRKRGK